MISYLFFGGLTTIVNYAVYAGCFWLHPFSATTIPNVIAWVVSVAFAYLTNRRWVFQSRANGAADVLREISFFTGSRVVTLLLETATLRVCVDMLGMPNLWVKLAANVLVILLNYLFSKFLVFQKRRNA